jgi:hypothetical protein
VLHQRSRARWSGAQSFRQMCDSILFSNLLCISSPLLLSNRCGFVELCGATFYYIISCSLYVAFFQGHMLDVVSLYGATLFLPTVSPKSHYISKRLIPEYILQCSRDQIIQALYPGHSECLTLKPEQGGRMTKRDCFWKQYSRHQDTTVNRAAVSIYLMMLFITVMLRDGSRFAVAWVWSLGVRKKICFSHSKLPLLICVVP